MQLIHKPLILALALLPLTLFGQSAQAGGLKLFISSGHYSGHSYHHSYRTRPGFALSYGTGGHYYGRSHYSRPYAYHGRHSYARPYKYHSRRHHYTPRHNYSYKHGYRRGHHGGGHDRHRGHKRKHCIGRC